ncbi:NUDIX hydrolase [Aliarcobacter butzleri]|uniref:NUDIX hydrolase n=1 Tax=Aliarcobacter butzleri TaxID=28197 RepID=UPI0024DE1325|nr:NUDIX hydrolase [Aliarcobacter butzleri]MDK2082014.1 NUDIX hydrolase [Aliarcobacter butzleri]MDN5096696.1 NUDIX hydrolase [Aliarcobacter butzleri]MDN5103024.1 NUDIX hydrolase [Aliarcobacter butzleri]MDN5128820.1 NUDIX hydrolase [Aliarcobacter butzleri]
MIELYKNKWFSVVKEEQWYYVVEKNSNNGAVILILEDNKNFIFIKNYRKAINKIVIELPRGYGENNETSLDTALRESLEETGYKINKNNIHRIGSVNPNSAILSSEIDIYFAKVSTTDKIKNSDSEVIDIVKINKDHINKYILDGKIKDSFSLTALHLYELQNN